MGTLTLTINTAKAEEIKEAIELLSLLVRAEKPKVEAEKPEVEAEKPKVEAEKPKVEAEKPKVKKASNQPTIEQVRAALSEKISDNRVALKNKLSELGAANVSTLEASKYSEFLEFLNSL